jgi:hypothetical protein
MRRILVALTVAVATTAPLVPAHAAEPPTIVRFGPTVTIDLGNLADAVGAPVCDFPVDGVVRAIASGHEILFNGQGVAYSAFTAGALIFTLTNMDTGKSITVNASGPGYLDATGLPVIGYGPWVVFEPIADGGLGYYRGKTRFVPAPYGFHAISVSGTAVNLCDRLA